MKIIINETSSDSTVIINGETFVVYANSKSQPVSDEVADLWKRTHQFLSIEDVTLKEVKEAEKKETIKEEEKKVESKVKKIK